MPEQQDGTIKERLENLLNKGYTKSQLARELEISRSTLIHFLQNAEYEPSKAIMSRINLNLEWIEKSLGHELIESLTLVYFQNQDEEVIKNFSKIVDKAEQETGYQVGYHGITFGGPVGFAMITSPGFTPMTDATAYPIFDKPILGKTESSLIGDKLRYSGNHTEATDFFKKHPDARVYLKFFTNYNFDTGVELKKIQEIILSPEHKDSVFLLESGLLSGRHDSFVLLATKNEQAYLDLLTEKKAIYSTTGKSFTESVTLPIVAPEMHYRSKHLSNMLQPRG